MRHDHPMLVLGHRGASVAAPENSPEALALADAQGADGVEIDVRLAPDGRLLVAHDPLPSAVADVDALHLPSLDDALDACGDRMLVNVEIKNSKGDPDYHPPLAIVGPVIDVLWRHGTSDRWLISSFSWSTVAVCRDLAPDLATACLTSSPVGVSTIDQIAAAGHAALHPNELLVDEAVVTRCHEAGLAVNVWTCNDTDRLVELAALGVDGVCTDVPDVALRALGRTGVDAAPRWPVHSG
jgi:glycerophosphoryl diester phosphodiesterase